MGESDGSWGELVESNPELEAQWDGYTRLPDASDNEALQSFCERKRLTIPALVRLGARLSADHVLAFAFPGGIKYRDLVTDRRWSTAGATWEKLKVVPASSPATTAIVAEGESDAARLTILFPDFDVAVMPAGALTWKAAYTDQLAGYERVLVGLDDDRAGNAGAEKILKALPKAVRYCPPANDWCDTETPPPLPDAPTVLPDIVFGKDLMGLEYEEDPSWFEQSLLPIGGQMILHAPAKSFKSYMVFDLASAIATGSPWCGFEPIEEPAKVCVIQFEVVWSYYRQRAWELRKASPDPELWDQNFGTWRPMMRPQLSAGNREHEDTILRPLAENNVQVVVVDPIRRAMGDGDLNSEQDVRRLLKFFERLQDEGITVIATHHDNKASSKGYAGMSAMTGSGAWAGDADTVVDVWLPKGDPEKSVRRNLTFNFRNAPAIGDRAFEMRDGELCYFTEPFGPESEEPGENLPSV